MQLHKDDGKTALAPTEKGVYFAPPWWLTPLYGGSHVALRCCWCGTALVHVKSGGTSEFPMHALEFASLCEATVARVLVARGLYIGCRLCSLDLEYLELIIGPPSGDRDVWDASRGNHALRCSLLPLP